MNKPLAALATLCVLSITTATLHAQSGTVINNPDLGGLSIYGPQTNARISDAKVTGGTAIEVTLQMKADNPWDAAAVTDITKAIHKGDHIHITVQLKGKSLDGSNSANSNVRLTMVLQFNSAPYNSIGGGKTVTLSPDWQTFTLDTVADKDYAPQSVAFLIHLATGRQVVDLGPVTVTDESLPTQP